MWKETRDTTGIIIFWVLFVILVTTSFSFFSLWHYGFFAPKQENIRREVFQNTRSYNEGKIHDLAKYRLEYISTKDNDSKKAIRSTVLLMFADYPKERLPLELRSFMDQITNEWE